MTGNDIEIKNSDGSSKSEKRHLFENERLNV